MKTLSKRQILALHDHLIAETGGQAGLRDDGLLESALAAPFAAFGKEEKKPGAVPGFGFLYIIAQQTGRVS